MSGPDEAAPTVVGERYVLVEPITQHPTSAVWQAHDDVASRRVVVKLITPPDPDRPEWWQSFAAAARRLETLSHPGIVRVLAHGEDDDRAWVALPHVDGQPLADLLTTGPDLSRVIGIVGQVALSMKAAHDVGLVHGPLDSGDVIVATGREDVATLVGFALPPATNRAGDLRALAGFARDAVGDRERPPAVTQFLDWLDDPHHAAPPTDAGSIGRTALALAASLSEGRTDAPPIPPPRAAKPTDDGERDPRKPWYDEAERKQVRNRLVALGAIVVVGGAVLLFLFGRGGGQTSVPDVVGQRYQEAVLELNNVGLRGNENTTVGTLDTIGTVVSEDPPAGATVRIGTQITLTVAVNR